MSFLLFNVGRLSARPARFINGLHLSGDVPRMGGRIAVGDVKNDVETLMPALLFGISRTDGSLKSPRRVFLEIAPVSSLSILNGLANFASFANFARFVAFDFFASSGAASGEMLKSVFSILLGSEGGCTVGRVGVDTEAFWGKVAVVDVVVSATSSSELSSIPRPSSENCSKKSAKSGTWAFSWSVEVWRRSGIPFERTAGSSSARDILEELLWLSLLNLSGEHSCRCRSGVLESLRCRL